VHSRVEIVADVAADGGTVLTRLHAVGQLGVRRTAPGTVHLIGTAAGPLGGDVVEVDVRVRAGARLSVRGVAATLALPGRCGDWATSGLHLLVEDGAVLDHRPAPLVVCRGARLHSRTRVDLRGSAIADVTEQVVLGRHGESGGEWTGQLIVQRDGVPVLRSTQRSDLLRAGPTAPGARPTRAVLTRLWTGGDREPRAGVRGSAVACPLVAGGLLVTAVGPDLSTVLADAAAAADLSVAAAARRAGTPSALRQ
jgi:urease accessory protein